MRKLGSVLVGGLLAMGSAGLALAQDARVEDYACHVKLAGGQATFVLVETDSHDAAREISATAHARAEDGTVGPVAAVEQCIRQRGEQFDDEAVQQLWSEFGL